jgi:hypothetical protein
LCGHFTAHCPKFVGQTSRDCGDRHLYAIYATLQPVKLKSEKTESPDHDYRNDAYDPARSVNRAFQSLKPPIDRCPPTKPCGGGRRRPVSTISGWQLIGLLAGLISSPSGVKF